MESTRIIDTFKRKPLFLLFFFLHLKNKQWDSSWQFAHPAFIKSVNFNSDDLTQFLCSDLEWENNNNFLRMLLMAAVEIQHQDEQNLWSTLLFHCVNYFRNEIFICYCAHVTDRN